MAGGTPCCDAGTSALRSADFRTVEPGAARALGAARQCIKLESEKRTQANPTGLNAVVSKVYGENSKSEAKVVISFYFSSLRRGNGGFSQKRSCLGYLANELG